MSTDWNAGYVTDIGYTYGYYGELNPFRCSLPLLMVGRSAPKVRNACELGFGQGLSFAIHAAAQPSVNWYGTDFNPAQAAFAADLVASSGAQAKIYDEAFADFCARTDLPDFEFICLHGIWSWISEDNRQVLVDFIRRKLTPGGVLYISYNTYPGWAATAPVRHLMKRHGEVMGAPGAGIVAHTDAAVTFVEEFLALDPLYARANPGAMERIKQVKGQDRKYVAHEYMNRDWCPMYFADMEERLKEAKVSFATSSHTIDNLYELNMTAPQIDLMRSIPDPSLRETIRDFCVQQQFRRDYWLRGLRGLMGHEQLVELREERVVMIVPRDQLPTKVRGALTEASLIDTVYEPIFELLDDHQIHTVQELEVHLGSKGLNFAQLSSALCILVGLGVIQAAQDPADIASAKARTQALNKLIVRRAVSVGDITYLASPVTGGGIAAPRFSQLFWLAMQNGGQEPKDWANFVWTLLSGQNQQVMKDGVVLSGDDNLAELNRLAEAWGNSVRPVWAALGI